MKVAPRAGLLVIAPVLGACAPDAPLGRTLAIDARSPAACPVTAGAVLELEALGDFEASNRTAELVPAAASNRELTFPLSTRAVSAAARDGGERWIGVAEVHGDTASLPLLPENRGCSLFRADVESYPRALEGQAASLSADGRILLVAGGTDQDGPDTLLFDVGTLAAGRVANGLSAHRGWGSVTPLGTGFLVAGGVSRELDVWATADVVEASITARAPERVRLNQQRARHAGVVLSSGETLLVGGYVADRNRSSESEQRTPLSTLEVVPPTRPYESRLAGLAVLAVGRITPVAIRLTDGRIFVGGGENAAGAPLSSVEWLTADASRTARPPVDLADFGADGARFAFTALPGGAVLAAARAPSGNALAFWISPEGFVEPLAVPAATATSPWDPLLIPASDGSPFLVVGPPEAQRVLRFNPWERSNRPFSDAPLTLGAGLPGSGMPAPIAIDAGAFVWLAEQDEQVELFALRHGVRGVYARDIALLAPDPQDPLRPLHVAPDWRQGPDSLIYDGKLRLGGDGSVPTQRVASAFVTDAIYADFDLTLALDSGPPPLVLFGESELGGPGCSWPEPGAAPEQLRVLRRGGAVLLLRGGLQRSCEVAATRLPIGLKQGGVEPSVIAGLTIRRTILPE